MPLVPCLRGFAVCLPALNPQRRPDFQAFPCRCRRSGSSCHRCGLDHLERRPRYQRQQRAQLCRQCGRALSQLLPCLSIARRLPMNCVPSQCVVCQKSSLRIRGPATSKNQIFGTAACMFCSSVTGKEKPAYLVSRTPSERSYSRLHRTSGRIDIRLEG